MKKHISLISLIVASCLFSHNLKAEDNQIIGAGSFKPFVSNDIDFFAPITFADNGVQAFLQNIYNRSNYALDILPNNFSHLLQFLHQGKKGGSRTYAKSTLKLFSNKIKGSAYVNAYAFSLLLKQLPHALSPYFKETPLTVYAPLKKHINDILYDSFLAKFDHLKTNPDQFFDGLSQDIVHAMVYSQNIDQQVSLEQLNHSTIRFLDLCLNKLIWSPQEHEEAWSSFNAIAQQLADLMDHNIIADTDDLDDLFHSLIQRFCFFVDIAGADLPIAFYEKAKNDLAQQTQVFCQLEEQEEWITKKSDYLMQTLLGNEAKVRAQMMS